jgi:hypothetical protein
MVAGIGDTSRFNSCRQMETWGDNIRGAKLEEEFVYDQRSHLITRNLITAS